MVSLSGQVLAYQIVNGNLARPLLALMSEPAGGCAIYVLVATQHTKIGGTEKGQQLVLVRRGIWPGSDGKPA